MLAIPSVLIGYTCIEPMLFGHFFDKAIYVDVARHPAMAELAAEFHGASEMALHGLMSLPFALAASGVISAYLLYMVWPAVPVKIASALRPLIVIGENKYFLDWFNEHVLAAGARQVGRALWRIGDVLLIDGALVNGSAKLVGLVGSMVRLLQTGYLYHYALVMILGVFALMTWFMFMHP